MTGGLAPLDRVFLIAQRLQHINARWEMQGVALFLLVAVRGQITKPQIERQLKMSTGSSHRNIEMMQDACLVRVVQIGGVNVVRLTEYGLEFARSLVGLMGPQK